MTSKLDIQASPDIPRYKFPDEPMPQNLRFCKEQRQATIFSNFPQNLEFGEALHICVQVRGILQEEMIEDVRPASLRGVHLVPEEEALCGFDAADCVQWPASVVYIATQIQGPYSTTTWRQRFWKTCTCKGGSFSSVQF